MIGWGHLMIFHMAMMAFLLTMKMMIRKYHSHKTLRETFLKLESDFPDIAEVDISKGETYHCLSRSPP